ncbi:MAG: hypothetical protein A2Y17_00640 [Clostridiales bacterium GWF2_38_85]|nr:MAG: hypothetical protein A2Y17_00640 [Clostridiales bacterium GWF2_38_85]
MISLEKIYIEIETKKLFDVKQQKKVLNNNYLLMKKNNKYDFFLYSDIKKDISLALISIFNKFQISIYADDWDSSSEPKLYTSLLIVANDSKHEILNDESFKSKKCYILINYKKYYYPYITMELNNNYYDLRIVFEFNKSKTLKEWLNDNDI